MSDRPLEPCPRCAHLQPSGTFKTHPAEKLPLRPFRVQVKNEESIIHLGDYTTIELARAAACGTEAVILFREKEPQSWVDQICQTQVRTGGVIEDKFVERKAQDFQRSFALTIYAVGNTVYEALQALGKSLDWEPVTDIQWQTTDQPCTWYVRFQVDGTSMKATGEYVTGGVVVLTWK